MIPQKDLSVLQSWNFVGQMTRDNGLPQCCPVWLELGWVCTFCPGWLVPLVRCCVVLTCCYRVHCVQLYIWHWHYKWQLVCWGVEGRKMLLWNIDVSFVGLWWCLRKFMFTITWVINAKQSVNSIQQVSFRFWWSNKAIRRTRYWGWDLKSCTQSFMKW